MKSEGTFVLSDFLYRTHTYLISLKSIPHNIMAIFFLFLSPFPEKLCLLYETSQNNNVKQFKNLKICQY